MQANPKRVAAWMLGAALAVLMTCGVALAEDWTPPPGAPPGCQPPPGECFPPPEGSQSAPAQPAPAPTPTPTPTAKDSPTATPTRSATAEASTSTQTSSPRQPESTKQAGSQGSTQDQGESGTAPTLLIADAALRVGQAVPVPISIQGVNPGEDPQVDAEVTITGGIGELSGTRGAQLTFRMPLSQLSRILPSLVVTASGEQVRIAIRAYPTDRPDGAITAERTLQATPEPTAEPSVMSAAPASPGTSATKPVNDEVTAQPSAVTLQARTITLPAYDPLAEPEQTVGTTVAAVALIGATALAAGGVATGLAGSPGSGGPAPQGPTGGADSRTAGPAGRREDATAMLAPGDSGSFLAIDTNLQGLAAAAGAASLRRRAHTWRLPLTEQLDRAVAAAFAGASRVSPLLARMIGDSTYLRAMFGSAAVLPIIAGFVLGVLGVVNVDGLALAPTAWLLGMVIGLGTLDAFAGFIAVATFTVGIVISGGVTDASSVRTLLGLAIIGFGPALIAGASRPMRRPGEGYTAWERLGDFVVIPLVGAFAVQGTIKALPALSGYDMPIAAQANLLALVALAGLLLRVCLEELAARSYPERIAAVAPPDLPQHSVARRLVLIAVRTFLFGFAAMAFIGNVWQLWVGLAIFAAAELCLLLASRMPNSPLLFQVVPVGVPRFVAIVILAIGLGTLASLLLQDSADIARTSFVLLLLPGLALAALGMFGKEPKAGDVRWYLRPGLRNLYRIGGVLMIIAAIWLTEFVPVG